MFGPSTEASLRPNFGAGNRALYEDSCLFVVPGSHKVPRTPEQRAQSTGLEAPEDPNTMPGAISVTLYRASHISF